MLDILCCRVCSSMHTGLTADLSTKVTLSVSITTGMPNIAGRVLPVEDFRIASGRVMSPSAGATWLPILRMTMMKTWMEMPFQEHLRTVFKLTLLYIAQSAWDVLHRTRSGLAVALQKATLVVHLASW